MNEQVEVRICGNATSPTLIYLPGLHGDWTLVGSFRKALAGRARFVEITYPRSLTWSLDDYANGIEKALRDHGIEGGWLLAESFGSQVAWQLAARARFRIDGVILAGGFVRHPARWGVRMAERAVGKVSTRLLSRLMVLYAGLARVRYRFAPEVLRDLNEFLARRTDLDRRAAQHRLELILQSDPCCIARGIRVPVYALSGLLDPIVPWWPVRRWLKLNCPGLRDYRMILRADHAVLATAPGPAAEWVLKWIK